MKKTHEKSRIYPVRGSYAAEEITQIVLQMESTGIQSNGNYVYLVETVSREEYDRTTAEGRAAAAEEELENKTKAFEIEIEAAMNQIDALEKEIGEELGENEQLRKAVAKQREEIKKLRSALLECRRIFGDLPKEIEELLIDAIQKDRGLKNGD